MKKGWLIVLVVAITFASFGIYKFVNNFLTSDYSEDTKNTKSAKLSEISWADSPKRIYYLSSFPPKGLQTSLVTGEDKKTISQNASSFLVLDSLGKLLVNETNKIVTTDKYGGGFEKIFEAESGNWISEWKISPDEKKVVIVTSGEKENWMHKIIYVINLVSKNIRIIDAKNELENYEYVERLNWSGNSNNLYIHTITYQSPNNGLAKYFSYNLDVDKVSKLGQEKSSLDGKNMISNFTPQSPTTTRDQNPYTREYSQLSPTGDQKLEIDWLGNIIINGNPIVFQLFYDTNGANECLNRGWIDNNHIVLMCHGIRVIEVNTKKIAILDKYGYDPQWFGQK